MIGVVSTHGEWELRRPADLEIEEQYEQRRQAQHVRRFGSLDSYQPPREFPCRGVLRVVEENGPLQTVRCDACPFETTMRLAAETPPREEQPF